MMSLKGKAIMLMKAMRILDLSLDGRDKVIEIVIETPDENLPTTVDYLTTLMTESQTEEEFLKKLETVYQFSSRFP